ncbi:MAG TPA: asparagine synthase C-terminal domain-containing protein [Caulobacteraceae bacterium]
MSRTMDWTPIHRAPDIRIWGRGAKRPSVHGADSVIVVGACHRRGSRAPCGMADLHPHVTAQATAERLSRETWGSYVALLRQGSARQLFRDPSGGLECLTWSLGRVRLVTSDSGPPVPGLLPPRSALDWAAIASWGDDRGLGVPRSGLEGVEAVLPGHLLKLDAAENVAQPVWSPSRCAQRPDHRDAMDGLVEAVGLAVGGLLGAHDLLVNEISGGLDSAIVADTLAQSGLASRVAASLNYYGERREGDERRYARAVAERCSLDLSCVLKPIRPLSEADFSEVSRGLRPAFPASDPIRDRDTAERLAASGATALVTGHGGDAVFFQMPTPLVAVDRVRGAGLRGLTGDTLVDIARFSRKPVWTVLAQFAKADRSRADHQRDATSAQPLDPWSLDASTLPPAKRLQISSLFQAQWTRGWSRRGAVADVLNPLLAQPVVEFCLALPVPELVEGGRDRSLARRAFRDRLPPLLIERRSKGDLTAYYGRLVAASLGYLRPLLLDGCLAEAGILDRMYLDAAMTPERLILDRTSGEILVAALIENWVRYWQTRVPDSARYPRPS